MKRALPILLIALLTSCATDDETQSPSNDGGTVTRPRCGQIEVSPESIDFGVVSMGDKSTQEVTILSVGDAPLRIRNISLTGSSDFRPLMGDREAIPFPTEPMPTGDRFTFEVVYEPVEVTAGERVDEGMIVVDYFHCEDTRESLVGVRANALE